MLFNHLNISFKCFLWKIIKILTWLAIFLQLVGKMVPWEWWLWALKYLHSDCRQLIMTLRTIFPNMSDAFYYLVSIETFPRGCRFSSRAAGPPFNISFLQEINTSYMVILRSTKAIHHWTHLCIRFMTNN